MSEGFDVLRVANFVIDTAKDEKKELTNLKLQKILFFLQGFYLHTYDKRLIDGSFSKWQYGPVEKDAYNYFKFSGSAQLIDDAFEFSTDSFKITPIPPISEKDFDSDAFIELKNVLESLLNIPTWRLVELTHKDKSWADYREEIGSYSAANYTDDQIKECYSNSLKDLDIRK